MYLDSDFLDMEIDASGQHMACVASPAHSLPNTREYGTTASSKVPLVPEKNLMLTSNLKREPHGAPFFSLSFSLRYTSHCFTRQVWLTNTRLRLTWHTHQPRDSFSTSSCCYQMQPRLKVRPVQVAQGGLHITREWE